MTVLKPSRISMLEFTILMASLMSIVAISIDALLPALGIIADDLHVTNANNMQYVVTCIFIGMGIGELLAGPLSDAYGRKKVLYVGLVFYIIGSIIGLTADTLSMLLIGRIIQGFGVSGPYTCAMSIVRDKYSGSDMARIMSLVMTIFMMVPAIAPSLGQAILWCASWRVIFILYMIYGCAIGVWLFIRLDETLAVADRVPFRLSTLKHGLQTVLSNRVTVWYTLCMSLVFSVFMSYIATSRQIFQIQFGVGAAFTLYFGGLALVLGAASWLNSRIVERFGMRNIALSAIAVIVVISALFLVLHYWVVIQVWMFVIYAAIFFSCFGLMFGNLNALAMEPMGHIAGLAAALIGSISSLISMPLSMLIGHVYNGTLIPLSASFLVLGILSALCLLYAEKPVLKNTD